MPLNVYYLDDEPDLCENFLDTFNSADIKVTTFIDPQEAVKAIKNSPPDLLFLDYRLPGTNGDKVAQSLDPKIPKFLVTGDMEVQTAYKFIRIFSKPFKEEELVSLLSRYKSGLRAA